jgi:predicted Zn-dependent protease
MFARSFSQCEGWSVSVNFREIAEIILNTSPAETEVIAIEQDENLTRFANNFIHQNVTERNVQIIVRAAIGKRVGIAVSNDARRERLEQLAARASDVARLQPENHDFNGMAKPQPFPSISVFDQMTAECPPMERALRVGVICRKAASSGLTSAGSMTTLAVHMGIANSGGVFAECSSTTADVSTVVMGSTSSGWAQASAASVNAIDTEKLADEAVRKTQVGANPVEFEAGEYPVILDSYATANLIEMLAFDGMGALAFQEGRSWLTGRIGQRIMADKITIVDDGLDSMGLPMPFDFEGVPKKPVSIIEGGVARGPVYDLFTAGREEGKTSTGHASLPSPSERYGPIPMNLFLRPGTEPLESLIKSTKFGIYVTRFWYTRTVHPRDAVVTGMTRDGTFVVRDGEIAHPIKSLRFTQSFVDALLHAEVVGSSPRLSRFGFGGTCVPPVKLNRFRFTSSTR